jgi:plasmid replication initiation protein
MMSYRLVIEEVMDAEVTTSYTRWVESVQVREADKQEVYLTFSSRFERIWLESKKRLPQYVQQKPANIGLRSQYALRLYSWAKRHVGEGAKTVSLEELRRVLGVEPKKTDLKIKLNSIERSKHRRVVALTFAIKTQAIPKGARNL